MLSSHTAIWRPGLTSYPKIIHFRGWLHESNRSRRSGRSKSRCCKSVSEAACRKAVREWGKLS